MQSLITSPLLRWFIVSKNNGKIGKLHKRYLQLKNSEKKYFYKNLLVKDNFILLLFYFSKR